MADEEAKVESSPTDGSDILAGLTPEQYRAWEMTEEIPEKPNPEEAAPSDAAKAPETGPAEKPAKTSPEAEADEKPAETEEGKETQVTEEVIEKVSPGVQHRFNQMTAKIRDLQRQVESAKISRPPKVEERSEATAGGPEVHPQGIPKPSQEDKNSDGSDKYATYEEFNEALAGWKADVRVAAALKADREQRDKERKEADTKKQEAELKGNWDQRVTEYEKEKPDFKEVALNPHVVGRFSEVPIIQGWIVGSPAGPALLYHLASKPDELARIEALDAFDQSRELTKLEISLSPPSQKPPPVKKETGAPNPPTVLAGRGTVITDEVEQAGARGDFEAYDKAATARELAASSGKG